MLVAVYFVGVCTWLPNQVGIAQKVDTYGPSGDITQVLSSL